MEILFRRECSVLAHGQEAKTVFFFQVLGLMH